MERKSRLSLNKLTKFVKTNNYGIKRLYCIRNECVFVALSTPKFQKEFILEVPSIYSIVCTEHSLKVPISKAKLGNEQHFEYWTQLKGDVMENDMMCIATKQMTLFYKDGKNQTYYLNKEEKPKVMEDEEKEEEKELDITTRADMLMRKIRRKKREKRRDNPVDIIFQDEDGNVLEYDGTLNQMIGQDDGEESDPPIVLNEKKIPDPRDDADISLGTLSLIIDIRYFFKNMGDIESIIDSFCKELEVEESQIREKKFHDVDSMLNNVRKMLKEKYKLLVAEEEQILQHLPQILNVYNNMKELIDKIKEDPKAYKSSENEIKRLKIEAGKAMQEYNIRRLKIREQLDEFLTDISLYVNDLSSIAC